MVLSERQLPLHSWVMLPGLWQALLFLLLLRTWLGGNYPGIRVSLELKRCVQEHSWLLGKTCSSVMTSRTTHICPAFSSVVLVLYFLFSFFLLGIFMYLNGKEKQAGQFPSPWGTVKSYLRKSALYLQEYVSTLKKNRDYCWVFLFIYLEKENNVPEETIILYIQSYLLGVSSIAIMS